MFDRKKLRIAICNHLESIREDDRKYPNRHQQIHKACCKNCPSYKGRSDPEADEYGKLPLEKRINHVFPCGWRPSKLCKGICDNYGVNEEIIKKLKIPNNI